MRMHPTRLPRNWLPTLPQKDRHAQASVGHPFSVCPTRLVGHSLSVCPNPPRRLLPFAEQSLSAPLSTIPCRTAPPRPVVGLSPSARPEPGECSSAPTNLVPCSQKAPVSCPIRNNMQNIFGIKKRLLLSLQADVVCQTEQAEQTEQTEQTKQTKRNVRQNKQGETRTHNPIRLQR